MTRRRHGVIAAVWLGLGACGADRERSTTASSNRVEAEAAAGAQAPGRDGGPGSVGPGPDGVPSGGEAGRAGPDGVPVDAAAGGPGPDGAAPQGPRLDDEVSALLSAAREAIGPCAEGPAAALQGWSGPSLPAVTPTAVREACAPAAEVLQGHQEALVGRTRDADRILEALARVGDDARVLALLLERGRVSEPLISAADHLVRSATGEVQALSELAGRLGPQRDRTHVSERTLPDERLAAELRRRVDNDRFDLGVLRTTFHNLAWLQRNDPEMVRRWSVDLFGARTRAHLARHEAVAERWTATGSRAGAVSAAFDRYLEAARAYVDAYTEGAAPFLAGRVRGTEAAQPHWDRLQAAEAAWQAAREEALGSLGPEGP